MDKRRAHGPGVPKKGDAASGISVETRRKQVKSFEFVSKSTGIEIISMRGVPELRLSAGRQRTAGKRAESGRETGAGADILRCTRTGGAEPSEKGKRSKGGRGGWGKADARAEGKREENAAPLS
ncbi:hypothetical protein GCM10017667_43990 [Streptomyces filamentosus]|uniref:Uncharacterized protein n=1 Tax=Streptomyces filamentosus TaxID=67294 RepID=A0A919BRX8_STRFL|nr:hypothetical protein GCM10017667_43990 [Streptomyces filamentosus]